MKLWAHEDVTDGGVMPRGSELQLPLGREYEKLRPGGMNCTVLLCSGLLELLEVQTSRHISE